MKPHKHVDVIKAWADGAKVEILNGKSMHGDKLVENWIYQQNPIWDTYRDYRVMKEPVITVKFFQLTGHSFGFLRYEDFTPDLEHWDLKITYQDGKAIKAELPA